MNNYLKEWLGQTFPIMQENEIDELNHYDIQNFANWMQKKIEQSCICENCESSEAYPLCKDCMEDEVRPKIEKRIKFKLRHGVE